MRKMRELSLAASELPTYEPFGERLLLAFVMLHASHDGISIPDALFYDLLDSQTDEEALYYIECHEHVHGF